MKTENTENTKTLKDLKIGSVIRYNDMANVDLDCVVLDSEKTEYGTFVNILHKETNSIEGMSGNTEITGRWELLKNAI